MLKELRKILVAVNLMILTKRDNNLLNLKKDIKRWIRLYRSGALMNEEKTKCMTAISEFFSKNQKSDDLNGEFKDFEYESEVKNEGC